MSKALLPPAPAPFEATPILETYLDKHFKKVMIILVALVIGALVFAYSVHVNNTKEEEASAALLAAKTAADYDAVIQKYAGSLAAGNALLLKADLLWNESKKDSSIEVLREFVANNPKHALLAPALMSLASKVESAGQKDDAKALFERLVSEIPNSELAPLAQIRIGDILWAQGKEDEARKVYESIPAKFSDADISIKEKSDKRVTWINARLPTKEVDGPPKPKKEEKPAAAKNAAPGAPRIELQNGGTLSPTVAPETSPAPAPALPKMLTPSDAPPAQPSPAAAPTVTVPPTVNLPKPAPAAPAEQPNAAPAPAATPAPAAPAPEAPAKTAQ